MQAPRDELFKDHLLELLDRYFLNNITPVQQDVLAEALQQAGVKLATIEHLREVWQTSRPSMMAASERLRQLHRRLGVEAASPVDTPSISTHSLATALSNLTVTHPVATSYLPTPQLPIRHSTQPSTQSSTRYVARNAWIAIGGVAAVAIIAAAGWFGGIQHLSTRIGSRASIYTTANGQRATITLPDGSTANLNVGSRLEVPANYAAGNRTLRLDGEALFSVDHQEESPFVVKTEFSTTRVLGTRFSVRHYATDTATTIAVRDGKVTVGTVILTAAQQTSVSAHGTSPVQRADDAQFSFADGLLMLRDMPLANALVELNRWYDVDIELGDTSLATQRIEGQFVAGSLAKLTEILEWTVNVRVVRNGRTLILYPK